jgi:hypothetical protein
VANQVNFNPQELASFEELFYDQMLVYRSHWRDDPKFDRTYTERALPHLPCPEMDEQLLLNVARYPIEHDFSLKRYVAVNRPYEVQEHMTRLARLDLPATDAQQVVNLQVDGCDGGQWQLLLRGQTVVDVRPGTTATDDSVCCLSAETFAALRRGQISVPESIRTMRVLMEGSPAKQETMALALEQVLAGS